MEPSAHSRLRSANLQYIGLLNGISAFQKYIYIYIYIYNHDEFMLIAWILLNLSCHLSLLSVALGRFARHHPVSTHSWWMYCFGRELTGVSMWKSPLKNFGYIFVPAFLSMLNIYCSSFLNGLWDGR